MSAATSRTCATIRLVLGLRHGEELRRMRQHGAADHGRHHGVLHRRRETNIAPNAATTSANRDASASQPACGTFTGRGRSRPTCRLTAAITRSIRMVDVPITIACGNYDRTRAILDGRVKVEGCAVTYLPLYPEEIFHRAFKFQEFDVSEMSFSSYHPHRLGRHLAPMSASRPSCRAFSAIPASISAPTPASRSRRTCAASASACRNIRSPRWSGCAA